MGTLTAENAEVAEIDEADAVKTSAFSASLR
jgi:hypothetical protein